MIHSSNRARLVASLLSAAALAFARPGMGRAQVDSDTAPGACVRVDADLHEVSSPRVVSAGACTVVSSEPGPTFKRFTPPRHEEHRAGQGGGSGRGQPIRTAIRQRDRRDQQITLMVPSRVSRS